MAKDQIPIEEFIAERFSSKAVQKIVQDWRVEPEQITSILATHFRDMGLFHVQPEQQEMIFSNILFLLKSSPEIKTLVRKARQEEQMKKKTRHAE